MTIKEATTVTTKPLLAPEDVAAGDSLLKQWRSQSTHDFFDHAVYAIARAQFAARNDKLNDEDREELVVRKLARAFSPAKKGDSSRQGFKKLERALHQVMERALPHCTFLRPAAEEEGSIRAQSMFLLTRLRTRPESFEQYLAPEPPPRPRKPYEG